MMMSGEGVGNLKDDIYVKLDKSEEKYSHDKKNVVWRINENSIYHH